ncbi:RluA family pseudouridine synthase [Fructilactobacillus cliffordii]|uniref:Pseudouridine synthase n=1 Tax=Fructilactobacillus cliffordii TaxID=2940299 RepID=A0A9Q8ZT49_9LACO|nr:RluA family pseudouridine synthase [Fructilactobacillus cliffordii]USS89159.1 RluA family pseudouridine synthase [Fructilactobacillus cliffordii]
MQWHYELPVATALGAIALRDFLKKQLQLPKRLVGDLRRNQRVLVNHRYQPMNTLLQAPDVVSLTFLPQDFHNPFPKTLLDEHLQIPILFENADFVIVNKPRGLKTHANQPGESGAVLNGVAAHYAPQPIYMIHRLDQETSGALLFGKSPAAVPILTKMIREKQIQREYLVRIRRQLLASAGVIKAPIGLDPTDQRKRRVNGPNAQASVTHYRVLQSSPTESLLAVQLETGRTHQIRVHLAFLGHPIQNDPLYDPQAETGQAMQLHSWRVRMQTPFTNQPLTITAPVPPEMEISFGN